MNEMNITTVQYQVSPISGKNSGITAVIDDITLSVPLDPANRHYAEILRQVEAGTLTIAEGNTPEPADS